MQQRAVVERQAPAGGGGSEPALDSLGMLDQSSHFRQLSPGERPQLLADGSAALARTEEVADLRQGEAGTLSGVYYGEEAQDLGAVAPLGPSRSASGNNPIDS